MIVVPDQLWYWDLGFVGGMLSHSIKVGNFMETPFIDVIVNPGTRRPYLVSFDALQIDNRYFSFVPVIPNSSTNFGLIIEALLCLSTYA